MQQHISRKEKVCCAATLTGPLSITCAACMHGLLFVASLLLQWHSHSGAQNIQDV